MKSLLIAASLLAPVVARAETDVVMAPRVPAVRDEGATLEVSSLPAALSSRARPNTYGFGVEARLAKHLAAFADVLFLAPDERGADLGLRLYATSVGSSAYVGARLADASDTLEGHAQAGYRWLLDGGSILRLGTSLGLARPRAHAVELVAGVDFGIGIGF